MWGFIFWIFKEKKYLVYKKVPYYAMTPTKVVRTHFLACTGSLLRVSITTILIPLRHHVLQTKNYISLTASI